MLTPEQQTAAIAAGFEGKTFAQIAEAIGVSVSTLDRARSDLTQFREELSRARDVGFEVRAESLLTLPTDDDLDVNRARLLSDNIKWYLARIKRETYGDKLDLNVNQQVDLVGIIGRVRQLQPMGNQAPMLEAQVIDAIELSPVQGVDTQSIDAPDATPSIFD